MASLLDAPPTSVRDFVVLCVSSIVAGFFALVQIPIALCLWLLSLARGSAASRKPKNVLITGASSGLGAGLAEELAAPGSFLALVGRNVERLNKVKAACEKKGAVVLTLKGDVTNRESMEELINKVDKSHPLDTVIANAGISENMVSDPSFAAKANGVTETNINGVLNTANPAIALFKTRKSGHIVLMSSLSAFVPLPPAATYSASKHFVRAWGLALRGFLRPHNIDVTVICPGFVKTEMTKNSPFSMPMLMSLDRASKIMVEGICRRDALVAFPLPMYLLVRLAELLPESISTILLHLLMPVKRGAKKSR